MRITKTTAFKPSVCRIDGIVGLEKAQKLREEDTIDVSESEFDKINEKNPNWFTTDGSKLKSKETK